MKERLKHWAAWLTCKAHEPAHLVYFAAVGFEAHGGYAIAALVCLALGIFGYLLHIGG